MQFVKVDLALDLVNIWQAGALFVANSPAPLRVCWVSSLEFDSYKVGDILAVTIEIAKPDAGHVADSSYAGLNHTLITIYHVCDQHAGIDASDKVVALSELLATAKRAGAKGGFSGVPRKPDFGEGEKMEAKTISLPPAYWAFIDSLPGSNRSDKIRKFIESNQIQLGKLPT